MDSRIYCCESFIWLYWCRALCCCPFFSFWIFTTIWILLCPHCPRFSVSGWLFRSIYIWYWIVNESTLFWVNCRTLWTKVCDISGLTISFHCISFASISISKEYKLMWKMQKYTRKLIKKTLLRWSLLWKGYHRFQSRIFHHSFWSQCTGAWGNTQSNLGFSSFRFGKCVAYSRSICFPFNHSFNWIPSISKDAIWTEYGISLFNYRSIWSFTCCVCCMRAVHGDMSFDWYHDFRKSMPAGHSIHFRENRSLVEIEKFGFVNAGICQGRCCSTWACEYVFLLPKREIFHTVSLILVNFRFTSQLKDVANAIVLVILLPWTICICISLFIIAKVNAKGNCNSFLQSIGIFCIHFQYSGTDYIYDLQMPFLGMSAPLCLSFIYFYIGEEFHSLLMDMSDAIYQTEWHRYPPSVQRYLLLMIMRARRPFYLSAYGIVTMNLPNFVGVCTLDRQLEY